MRDGGKEGDCGDLGDDPLDADRPGCPGWCFVGIRIAGVPPTLSTGDPLCTSSRVLGDSTRDLGSPSSPVGLTLMFLRCRPIRPSPPAAIGTGDTISPV